MLWSFFDTLFWKGPKFFDPSAGPLHGVYSSHPKPLCVGPPSSLGPRGAETLAIAVTSICIRLLRWFSEILQKSQLSPICTQSFIIGVLSPADHREEERRKRRDVQGGESSHRTGRGEGKHNKDTFSFLVSFLLSLGIKFLTLSQKAGERELERLFYSVRLRQRETLVRRKKLRAVEKEIGGLTLGSLVGQKRGGSLEKRSM